MLWQFWGINLDTANKWLEKNKMNINGFIMQKRNETFYQGVEGDNWYLNYDYSDEMDLFYKENIAKSWENTNYIDVCNDMNYIHQYINISKDKDIEYRILLCMTDRNLPTMTLGTEMDLFFWGYDYAYAGGSYYSAILNDIISRRIPVFANIQLNNYGLFETYTEVINFVNIRQKIKRVDCSMKEYMEDGDFVIYKVFEVKM